MHSRLWKTLLAALLAAVELLSAGVNAGTAGTSAALPGCETQAQAATAAAPVCEMACCRVRLCECEAVPAPAPPKPALVVPVVQPLEYKLTPPSESTDLLSATLEHLLEPKAPAPPDEIIVHAPEAPLFALHCAWLI
ncbi:MAG: hypothetical protein EOP86_01655 [Verrucomicrobiaceae bacterium]|nr:MAG: hypothetical protein EOP86_01655 [Verrucomicrobiaceae bacterium]